MSKEIILTQNQVAIVDDADFEMLNQYKWCAEKGNTTYYAKRLVGNRQFRIHRVIMGVVDQPEKMVDHINRDGLDNQRSNLRIATPSQNGANSNKQKNTSSRYKGVSWNKDRSKWVGKIYLNSKLIFLGYYTNELYAALIYDQKAIELFGEFATTNKSLGLL